MTVMAAASIKVEALKDYAHASEIVERMEGISEQTAQIDRSIRRMRMQIADGYISMKKQFMTNGEQKK